MIKQVLDTMTCGDYRLWEDGSISHACTGFEGAVLDLINILPDALRFLLI